jgi:hypothetical protein
MSEISVIRDAIVDGAPGDALGALPLPGSYRGAVVRADEQEMFAGVPSEEKDPRKSLHLDEVPLPELAPDEALVAVMASSVNFNTVWTSIFEPVPTFGFLQRLGRESVWGARHDQPFHVVGSDAAGVVLRGHAGLLEGALDGDAAQVGAAEALERAAHPAHRGAGAGNDDGGVGGHGRALQVGVEDRPRL